MHCSKCGSCDCFKRPDLCLGQKRAELTKFLFDRLLGSDGLNAMYYSGQVTHPMIHSVRCEVERRMERVDHREAQKTEVYRARKARSGATTELDVERLMSPGATPGYEGPSREKLELASQ